MLFTSHGTIAYSNQILNVLHLRSLTEKLVVIFQEHSRYCQSVRYSPDGVFWASAGFDGKIFLYDGKDSELVSHFILNITSRGCPAVVAWFVEASVFHLVNSAPSANGGSNPAWECCIDRLNSKEFVAIQIARRRVLFGIYI